MNVSGINSNLGVAFLNVNKTPQSHGDFGSVLREVMNQKESAVSGKQELFAVISPYFKQFSDTSNLSTSEFRDLMTSFQTAVRESGVKAGGAVAMLDFAQMTDSEIEGIRVLMEAKMETKIAGNVFGLGGLLDDSQMNIVQTFVGALNGLMSMNDEGEEESFLELLDDEPYPPYLLGGDFIALREKTRTT